MPTLKDVAHASGHSLTTAASILRGDTGRFSEETITRVKEAATRLGYVPHLFSRNMKKGKSGTVIFLVAGKPGQATVDPRILTGLVDRAAEVDVKIIVERITVEDAFDNPKAPFKTHRYYDGIILNFHSFGDHSHLELEATINRFGVPVVWYNANWPQNAVYVNERQAGIDLAGALLAEGKRRFIYAGLHPDNPHYSSRERLEGFRSGLDGVDRVDLRTILIIPEDFKGQDDSRFHREMAALASGRKPADAIVFSHPAYASGFLSLPRPGPAPDLYTFDMAEPRFGETVLPGIDNDWSGMSRAALDHLLTRIGGGEASTKVPSVGWKATLRIHPRP